MNPFPFDPWVHTHFPGTVTLTLLTSSSTSAPLRVSVRALSGCFPRGFGGCACAFGLRGVVVGVGSLKSTIGVFEGSS